MLRLLIIILSLSYGTFAQDPVFGVFTYPCSQAMYCVDLNTCDQFGVMSPNTVSLSPDEEANRQKLVPCLKADKTRGVCCRDPNFVDDWPNAIGNDELSQPVAAPQGKPGCPSRNRTAMPDKNTKYDETDFDAGAGEFPWQAAVFTLDDKLLCTCFFTENNTCTTTASCVAKVKPGDIKIAVGMYDIANPTKVQELPSGDKKAQFSPAKYIAYDPKYNPTTKKRDIAVIHMEKEPDYNYYTLPICLDRPKAIPFFKYDDCVVTGWGKKDNTYHWSDVLLLTEEECEELVPGFDREQESCARADHDVCELMDFGSGFQCRMTGKRNKPGDDIYWLKGVYSAVNTCDPKTQIITYSRIEFEEWFDDALWKDPTKFSRVNQG